MKIGVIGLRGFPDIAGGVESHCQELYSRLAGFVDECLVCVRKPYFKDNPVLPKGVRFVYIPTIKNKYLDTLLYSFFSGIVMFFKRPHIVHVHNVGPAFFSLFFLKMRKIPVVMTYHSQNYQHLKWPCWARRLLKLCEKISLKNVDAVIAVSEYLCKALKKEFPEKSGSIVYIPNGASVNSSRPRAKEYFAEIGVENKRYFLAAGRIVPEKGFDILIEAFKNIREKNGFKLVLAGGFDYKSRYYNAVKESIGKTRDIILLGFVDKKKMNMLYSGACAYVLSSFYEGNPLVLLEAMSFGLPVVTSDIPQIREFSFFKERHFKKGDKKALQAKLDEYVKGRGGLSDIEKDTYRNLLLNVYDWGMIVERTLSVYKRVLR